MAVATELDEANELLAKKDELILAQERELRILREEIETLKRGLFGRKTERLDPGQLRLFTTEASEAQSEEAAEVEVPAHKRRKKGHGRTPFAAHLPRNVIECDVPKNERVCPDCGEGMQPIGVDVTERGEIIPARVVVNRYERKKYACRHGHAVKTGEAPAALIDRCKYEPSAYAFIATSKYCDHLPLNRLEGILKREGVHLPKQTMWDMLVKVDELVAQPILKQMHVELLESEILHGDETPVAARVEGQKGSRKSYIWDWRAPGRDGEPDKVLTQFTLTRERDGPVRFLREWSGTLLVDGYSGFDEVVRTNKIVRAGCWSHARRKFKEALDAGSKDAASVLRPIQRLFRLERAMRLRAKARDLDGSEFEALRERVRVSRGRVVVDAIYEAAAEVEARRSTLPKSKLGKAIGYAFRQRGPLEVFLGDARIEIHNNDAERDLRHIAVGRNNWMVFASPRGGEVASRLYSLVLSCKRAGVDPHDYIEHALTAVSTTPASQISTLTPWAWAKTRTASTD